MHTFDYPTPWSLPVGCFSIIVRHDAVIRSFPGGVKEFLRAYPVSRRSWVLFLLNPLSDTALDTTLARLQEAGLTPGADLAVADKIRRPILDCPGIVFETDGRYSSKVSLGREALPESDWLEPSPVPPVVRDARGEGRGLRKLGSGEWAVLSNRKASGASLLESRQKYLCALRYGNGFVLSECGDRWLGDIPASWYDEDGELLPEHCDEDGDLDVPSTWYGHPVTYFDGRGFWGGLWPVFDDFAVEILNCSDKAIQRALEELEWPPADLAHVLHAIRRLATA